MKKYILNIVSALLSLYLAFSSFILIKIVTNDIILNSYKLYSSAKINGNVIVEKAESVYEKGKLWFNKWKNQKEADKLERQYQAEMALKKKEQEELIRELKFNQKVLAGLPYVIFIIVFIFTYLKILDTIYKIKKYFILQEKKKKG